MYTHSIIIHSFRDKFVHFEQLLGIANWCSFRYGQGVITYCCYVSLQEKYPNVDDTHINSLIGGFFLLRFLNPAIVTPNGTELLKTCLLDSIILFKKLLIQKIKGSLWLLVD